jgi:uncharacterized protein (DUF1810 family)
MACGGKQLIVSAKGDGQVGLSLQQAEGGAAMDDKHSSSCLDRFVDAQKDLYPQALRELQAGQKRSHWMWFIFPQLTGLGRSPTAQYFALTSLDEARAYLAHPVLGERLRAATSAVLPHSNRSLGEIFGQPDDMKFRSSMTLFAEAAEPGAGTLFRTALTVFCNGEPDRATLRLLEDQAGPSNS